MAGVLLHVAGVAQTTNVLQRVAPARSPALDVRHVVGQRIAREPRRVIDPLTAVLAGFVML